MATCPAGHQSASDDFCDVCGFRIDAGVFTQTGAAPVMTGNGGGRQAAPPPGGGPAERQAAASEACPRCGTPRVGQFCEDCGYSFAAPQPKPPSGRPAWAPSPPAARTPPAYQPSPAYQPPPPQPPASPPSQLPPTTLQPSWPDAASSPVPPTSLQPSWPDAPPPPPAPAPPAPAPAPPAPAPAPPPPAYPASPAGATWSAVVTADRDYYESMLATSGPDAAAIGFPAYCPQRRFRLSGSEVRVGRRSVSRGIDPEIDLTGPPADPGVSRLHALLVAAPDGTWSVVDPGSANGTFVNGDEIPQGKAVSLRDGDCIHIGAWTALTITRDT